MKFSEINSQIFTGFKIIVKYEDDLYGAKCKNIYMLLNNNELEKLVRFSQLIDRVTIKNNDDALGFLRLRTSPILSDKSSAFCFGELCLEVIPVNNLKYDFSFGNKKAFNQYIAEYKLFPDNKEISEKYSRYPIIEKGSIFKIKRLIMNSRGFLYDVEEHVSKNGVIIMEKRQIIDKNKNIGRNIYFFI